MKKAFTNFKNSLTNNASNKYMIILTIICIILLVGASYALVTNDYFTGKKHSIIAGKLIINYTENDGTFSLDNQIPLTDNQGLAATDNIYSFTIENTGNVNASYRIKVVDTTETSNKLSVENIKYSIRLNNGDWSLPFVLTDDDLGRTLWDGAIDVGETLNVNVKFWIDINTTVAASGKIFSGKINVESVQLVEDGYTDVLGPTITLAGSTTINLVQGGTFTDAGITSIVDSVEGTLSTSNVKRLYEYYDGEAFKHVTGVDTSVKGVYFITYSIANSSGIVGSSIRIVTVSTNSNVPTITLSGDVSVSSSRGVLYTDPGVTASDTNSNSLASSIAKYGYVNPNVGGEYSLKYAVEDANGNFNGTIRKVRVLWANYVFNYTGGYQTFSAPYTGYYNIELNGAQGGTSGTHLGGNGALVDGDIYLIEDEKLYIYIGGSASSGGYNGGSNNTTYTGGGGATDVRYFGDDTPSSASLEWNSNLGLNSRIIVASGGSGAAAFNVGTAGGLLTGYRGAGQNYLLLSIGGTQTFGGAGATTEGYTGGTAAFGIGGILSGNNAGGGAGYYGGGSGIFEDEQEQAIVSGASGSSFISGYAGVNAITAATLTNNPRTHTNNTLHYSLKYFIAGSMTTGTNSGNGSAEITYLGTVEPTRSTNLNSVRYIKNCTNGNSLDSYNRWVEIQAIKDGENKAYHKLATGITNDATYPISNITDGDITSTKYALGSTGSQCVIIDLGSAYDLDEIAVWHDWSAGVTYTSDVTSISSDSSTWTNIISESSAETSQGKRINVFE